MQETFLCAWRSRDSFDGSSMFRAWLYRIATNVCLDTDVLCRPVPVLRPAADTLETELVELATELLDRAFERASKCTPGLAGEWRLVGQRVVEAQFPGVDATGQRRQGRE